LALDFGFSKFVVVCSTSMRRMGLAEVTVLSEK
jgi:hypothetical protein